MLLLLYCLPLLFKVWQRSVSLCGCYIVYHYCLRFDKGVVHLVVVILTTIPVYGLTEEWFMFWLLYCIYLLFKVWQRNGSCCGCYNVYPYCLRYDSEVIHFVVVILSTYTSVFNLYIHWIWHCFDNYFTYFIPVFKYCYSDSRTLWTVMRAGG